MLSFFFHSQLVHTFSSYLLCQGYQWQSGWPCLAYTSVGIALTTLVCIVVFHIYIQLKATAIWKSILGKLGLFVRSDDAVANNIICFDKIGLHNKQPNSSSKGIKCHVKTPTLPTVSVIELKEFIMHWTEWYIF